MCNCVLDQIVGAIDFLSPSLLLAEEVLGDELPSPALWDQEWVLSIVTQMCCRLPHIWLDDFQHTCGAELDSDSTSSHSDRSTARARRSRRKSSSPRSAGPSTTAGTPSRWRMRTPESTDSGYTSSVSSIDSEASVGAVRTSPGSRRSVRHVPYTMQRNESNRASSTSSRSPSPDPSMVQCCIPGCTAAVTPTKAEAQTHILSHAAHFAGLTVLAHNKVKCPWKDCPTRLDPSNLPRHMHRHFGTDTIFCATCGVVIKRDLLRHNRGARHREQEAARRAAEGGA